MADTVIYAATQEFGTQASDTPASTGFIGTLDQPFSFRRTILGPNIGGFIVGDGIMDISNTDAFYDYLIGHYSLDGRSIVVKAGRLTDPYSAYFVVFSGTAADWNIDEATVHIILRDNSYKLTVPAQPNIYSGTGGSNGGTDLTGKRKPRAFGYVLNVSPPLVTPSQLIYQVNDGQLQSVDAVYDRGVALSAGSDFATYDLLVASTPSAGFYNTCLAQGFIKLGSSPTGTVTADLQGDKTGGVFVSTTGDVVRRLLTATTLVDPTDLYTASFTTLNTTQPADIGYWLSPDDTSTVSDVISNLMNGIGGWGGFRRDGKFEVSVFLTPAGTVPADFYDVTDIFDIKREPLPSALTPTPYRWRVAYQNAWTTQTDLAGSVSADRKLFVAEPFRLAEASDLSIKTDHPFAKDPDPIKSYFRNLTDASTEANRLLNLYGVSAAALYRLQLSTKVLRRNVGESVTVTYPRWDLTAGRLLRIVELNEDAKAGVFEVTAYG